MHRLVRFLLITIVSGALLFLFLAGITLPLLIDPFPPREQGTVPFSGEKVRWRGGVVGLCDYSTYPGGYDWQVEWVGDDGERKVLLHIGDDNTPLIRVGRSRELRVYFRRRISSAHSDNVPMLAVFEDFDHGPVLAKAKERRHAICLPRP